MAEELDISKSLEQSIRDSRKIQADTNSELNKSINLLSQINDLRDASIAKIKALNKESINTKEIEKQFQKAKEKEELSLAKMAKLKSSLSNKEQLNAKAYLASIKGREILEEKIQRAKLKGDLDLVSSLGDQLNLVDQKIFKAEKDLNIDERRYAAAVQANKIASETSKLLKGDLEIEKEIQKSVGLTGRLMGAFSQKLGLGSKYYEEIVEKARELEEEGKKLSFIDKLKALKKVGVGALKETFSDPLTAIPAIGGVAAGAFKLAEAGLDGIGNAAASAGNFMAGLSEDSGNVVRGLTSGVSDLAKKIPLVGGLIGGLIDGFSALLDLILGVDNMIVKTGRQLNLSAEGARSLYRGLAAASQASGDVYMNGKKYLESQLELTQQLGTTNILSDEILRTNVQLKDFAGLEADTRARIAESAQITGRSAEGTVKSVLGQVKALQRATGISFQYQQVLKEVSSLGGYLGLQFARYPDKLTKAFLSTKALGLELKQLDSIANSFLDFESSISKEFEAQLITGKEINLNKAREAFLNNDLATAASEIAEAVGSAANFEKMRRIEQEALADAMNMSRDQLADMLKQQELYTNFGVKNREELLKQVDLLRQSGREQEAIAKAGGEAAYNDLVRASAQEKLALLIEKIKQSIVEFVENSRIIEKVEAFIDKLTKPETIKGIIGTIRDALSTFIEFAGELLADIIEVGGEIANFFTFGKKGDERERSAYELASRVRAGYMETSARVQGTRDYGAAAVSVEKSAAKEKVNSENNIKKSVKEEIQPMMVAASNNNNNNNPSNMQLFVSLDDGINKANLRFNKGSLQDQQAGKAGTVVVYDTLA
jgi:hypothetical protein